MERIVAKMKKNLYKYKEKMGNVLTVDIGLPADEPINPENIAIGLAATGPIDWNIVALPYDHVISQYIKYFDINKKLKILSRIPKYIKMEMMENETTLSFYQLYHLDN